VVVMSNCVMDELVQPAEKLNQNVGNGGITLKRRILFTLKSKKGRSNRFKAESN
jgi:hypothetical protein